MYIKAALIITILQKSDVKGIKKLNHLLNIIILIVKYIAIIFFNK